MKPPRHYRQLEIWWVDLEPRPRRGNAQKAPMRYHSVGYNESFIADGDYGSFAAGA